MGLLLQLFAVYCQKEIGKQCENVEWRAPNGVRLCWSVGVSMCVLCVCGIHMYAFALVRVRVRMLVHVCIRVCVFCVYVWSTYVYVCACACMRVQMGACMEGALTLISLLP